LNFGWIFWIFVGILDFWIFLNEQALVLMNVRTSAYLV
jgi:hypothetical protein